MSAAIVPLTATSDEPHQKANDALGAFRSAFWELHAQARDAGLRVDPSSPVSRLFRAGCRYAHAWERRATRLQRQLQAALASDALTDDQRAEIIRTLTGNTRRDAKLLTASEREYLDELHALSQADRAAVRRIARALARKGDA
jgi:hypothetical protein